MLYIIYLECIETTRYLCTRCFIVSSNQNGAYDADYPTIYKVTPFVARGAREYITSLHL